MSDKVGAAAAVKMCFGMTTKDLSLLRFNPSPRPTDSGCWTELQQYLGKYKPATLRMAQEGLVTMPPKAYRWVHEMLEISETAAEEGRI